MTLSQVVGLYRGRLPTEQEEDRSGLRALQLRGPDDEALSDWMTSLIKTMRADMDSDKLYPPGPAYIIVCRPSRVEEDCRLMLRQEYQGLKSVEPKGFLARFKGKPEVRRKSYRVVSRALLQCCVRGLG